MSAISTHCSKPLVYSTVPLVSSVALALLTIYLCLGMHLAVLPTALLACTSAGCFCLAIGLYGYVSRLPKAKEAPLPLPCEKKESVVAIPSHEPESLTEEELHNKKLFEETQQLALVGKYLNKEGKVVEISSQAMCHSASRFESLLPSSNMIRKKPTLFRVSEGDILDAVLDLERKSHTLRTTVPLVICAVGSQVEGITQASSASIGDFCKRSNLNIAIAQCGHYYPLPVIGGLYFNQVSLFRERDGQLLKKPRKLALICASVPDLVESQGEQKLLEQLRTLLRKARQKGHINLVFNAFGCGTCQNSPSQMAYYFYLLFQEAEFKNCFRSVIFAIKVRDDCEKKERDLENLQAFKKWFPN